MKKLTILSGIIVVLSLQTVCGMESNANDTDLLPLAEFFPPLADLCPLIAQAPDANNTSQNETVTNPRFLCKHNGCNKVFTQKYNLNIHMRIHTGAKPFKCAHDGCSKTFTRKEHLNRHMVTHTDKKRFKCRYNECTEIFTQQSSLNKHIATHTGIELFLCTYKECDKSFTQKGSLNRHMITHADEKHFKCSYEGCNKAFTRKDSLNEHVKRKHSAPRRTNEIMLLKNILN